MVFASTLRAGAQPAPGYRLLNLLGRGAFGSVWKAQQADGTFVALKFMPYNDGQSAARELRAIQIIRQLRHPGLLRIHQIWCQPRYLVVSMELAGSTLADFAARHQAEHGRPPTAGSVCQYLAQVAEVLDFLNARQHLVEGRKVGFQHCDVKPSNLLLFGDKVKLTDFGLAAQTAATVPTHFRGGTPGYTAPEIHQGLLSQQTDQYALAVTYCELRTGRLPFAEAAPPGSEPDLSLLGPEEQPLLTRALARTPQDRWPSCREFLAQLRRVAG
jgi:serine/threonine protein kinase